MRRPSHLEIADLLEKPGHLIRRAHQVSVALFEARSGAYNITAPQHVVMTALFKHAHVDQVSLAAMIGLDKVTTGNIVSRLQKRGLIVRRRSPSDGRAHELMLSEAGTRMLMEMQHLVKDYHQGGARQAGEVAAAHDRRRTAAARGRGEDGHEAQKVSRAD